MKHIFKRGLPILLALTVLVCVCALFSACDTTDVPVIDTDGTTVAGNAAVKVTGMCDDGLTWTLYEDGALTLTGTPNGGKMFNYKLYGETPAWKAYAEDIRSLTLSDGIKVIADEAFSNLKNLIWVQLGQGVETVGANSFRACSNLRRVILPSSVKAVNEGAFNSCYRMYEARLNEGLTSVGDGAFANCNSLVSVTIPSTLTSRAVSANAFAGAEKLLEVISPTTIEKGSDSFGGVARNASEVHSGESKITKDDDGYMFFNNRLVGYTGTATELTLPEKAQQIAPYAFYANTAITSVNIGSNVTVIGKNAFEGCDALKTLTVGENVTGIGADAFAGCYALETLNYQTKNFTGQLIADGLFAGATNLKTVTFGTAVRKLPASMFRGCVGLESVTLPDGVTSVPESLFEGCSALKTVVLGSRVNTISSAAFKNCVSLSAVNLTGIASGAEVNSEAFYGCRSLTMLDLSKVRMVYDSAFYGCSSLTGVLVGELTESIGESAFGECYKLVDVVNRSSISMKPGQSYNGGITANTSFPIGTDASRLKNVDGFLFFETSDENYLVGYVGSATRVTLPTSYNGGTYVLYNNAFNGDMRVETVTIGAGVSAIGRDVFKNCAALKSVNMTTTVAQTIGEGAFDGCKKLRTVVFGDAIVSIESYAFRGCESLTSLTLPDGVTTLGSGAFAGSGVTSITVGSGVQTLPAYIFSGCTNLENAEIPGVETVGAGAFANCTALRTVVMTGATAIEENAFFNCSALRAVDLKNVQTVGASAFANCYNLACLTVGEQVSQIGRKAFFNCQKLAVVINKSPNFSMRVGTDGEGMVTAYAEFVLTAGTELKTDGDYTYMVKDEITYLVSYDGNETVLTLPATLGGSGYEIFRYAFYGTPVTEVTIPAGVTKIGTGAFAYSKLEKVTVSGTVEEICTKAFEGSALREMTLKYGVQTIGPAAFESCRNLRFVVLPDSVTVIDFGAFRYCDALIRITLSNRLTKIGAFAFDGCYSLVQMVIPSSVTTFDTKWFADCLKMAEVVDMSGKLSMNSLKMNAQVASTVISLTKTSSHKVSTDANGFIFYSYNGTNLLLGYEGTEKNLVLPDNYEGSSYEIYRYAFYGRDDIESIQLSRGVTAIGDYAFAYCTSLRGIYLPDTVSGSAGVGKDLFWGCSDELVVATGFARPDNIPTNWNADWNTRSADEEYSVVFGLSYEKFLLLVSD